MQTNLQHLPEWVNVAIIGCPQHGKSTLVGYTMFALEQVDPKTMTEASNAALARGDLSRKFAYLLDRTQAERRSTVLKGRGVTRENSRWGFARPNGKHFLLIDSPGHYEYTSHMIGALSEADAAVIVVAISDLLEARDQPETQRMKTGQIIPSAIGQIRADLKMVDIFHISQVIVAIHKCDEVAFSQTQFEAAKLQLELIFHDLGQQTANIQFIPTAVLAEIESGHNIIGSSPHLSQWYHGPTLLEAIEQLQPRPLQGSESATLRMQVNRAYAGQIRGFELVLTGKIYTGHVRTEDKLTIQPSGVEVRVRTIKPIDTAKAVRRENQWPMLDQAAAGELVGIGCNITDPAADADIHAGELVYIAPSPAIITDRLQLAITSSQLPQLETIGLSHVSGFFALGYFQTGFQVTGYSLDNGATWQYVEEALGISLLIKDVSTANHQVPMMIEILLAKKIALDPASLASDLNRVILLNQDQYVIFGGQIIKVVA